MIGINDLFQRLRTPLELATKWRSQIEQARLRQPQVDFVLVQAPLTWVPGVAEYNAWLIRLAAAVDMPESRVVTTELAQLDPYTDTYDHVHPTAGGEWELADVVAAALVEVGVGAGSRRDLMDVRVGRVGTDPERHGEGRDAHRHVGPSRPRVGAGPPCRRRHGQRGHCRQLGR